MAGQPIDTQVYEAQPVPAVNAHKTNEEVRRKESRVYRVVEQATVSSWMVWIPTFKLTNTIKQERENSNPNFRAERKRKI